jgi:hypothetical protein
MSFAARMAIGRASPVSNRIFLPRVRARFLVVAMILLSLEVNDGTEHTSPHDRTDNQCNHNATARILIVIHTSTFPIRKWM